MAISNSSPLRKKEEPLIRMAKNNCLCSGWDLYIAFLLTPRPCFANPTLEWLPVFKADPLVNTMPSGIHAVMESLPYLQSNLACVTEGVRQERTLPLGL